MVKANLLAMGHPGIKGGEVYNIATSHAVSLLELLQSINRLNGADTKKAISVRAILVIARLSKPYGGNL